MDASSRRTRDARVVRTRAALRDALIALLARHPFMEITAAMVVAEAGAGYATFFRHYADTAALLTDAADAMIAELVAIVGPALRAGTPDVAMVALAAYVDARRDACRAMLSGAGDAVRAAIVHRAIQLAAAAPIDLAGGLPPALTIRFQTAAAVEVLGWWLDEAPELIPADVARLLRRLVIAPVLPDRTAP
ncbi:hypothetical protein [Sphingomonas sanxanigenens]|uniref:hypothetical protein n=1 Tax=Sphingomonas sanxanigenens TaxID=397260 RepID=UPI00046CF68E|nr:hypothetical protein [Sphingomonas sanxanigenens]